MSEQVPPPDSSAALPPVEPPSATFILQLFVVPGVLVAVIVAFVVLAFGWIGGGPQTPQQFLEGLKSPSALKRGKTAQDLAQVLPRSAELRGNVGFALDLADLLEEELRNPPTVADPDDHRRSFLLEYYLPSAAASFQVPAALPLLERMVGDSVARAGSDEAYRQRLRNAVFALALMGSRLQEFDALPVSDQERMLQELQQAARDADTPRVRRARQAAEVLRARRPQPAASGQEASAVCPASLAATLAAAAQASDEMTRKFVILACANWFDPQTERILVQLTGGQDDLPDQAFETPDRPFRPADRIRGSWEIRHNAALALARHGSARTPWDLVLDTLDETQMRSDLYADNPGMALSWVLKALQDLDHCKRHHPEVLAREQQIVARIEQLVQDSSSVAVQVEARKLLQGASPQAQAGSRTPRELLLIVGVGVSVLFLLALAVLARWKRAMVPGG